jgi:hypothetical protein
MVDLQDQSEDGPVQVRGMWQESGSGRRCRERGKPYRFDKLLGGLNTKDQRTSSTRLEAAGRQRVSNTGVDHEAQRLQHDVRFSVEPVQLSDGAHGDDLEVPRRDGSTKALQHRRARP